METRKSKHQGLQDYIDMVNDPTMLEEYERIYEEHLFQFKQRYPKANPEDAEFWIAVTTFLGEADDISLRFPDNTPPDPAEIKITICPDYGS